MWSLQEVKDKAKVQLNNIREVMDRYGSYHPEMETGNHQLADGFYGLGKAEELELRETLDRLSLAELLAKGGNYGVAYLTPTKLHDTLIMYSQETDIVPKISINPIAMYWEGANVKLPIIDDYTYYPQEFISGGQIPDVSAKTDSAPTLAMVSFGLAPKITTDMLEDNAFNLVQFHATQAAKGIGKKASTLALTILKTATDGVGTMNPVTAGTAETTPAQVLEGIDAVGCDEFLANTMIVTPEAWEHSISGIEVAGGTAGDYWRPLDAVSFPAPSLGYHAKFHMLDVLFAVNTPLHKSTDAQGAAFDDCVTIVFDRNNALFTARKRWMQIDNYADPVKDLAGCVITCRQDSVTVYDDAIAVITEQ